MEGSSDNGNGGSGGKGENVPPQPQQPGMQPVETTYPEYGVHVLKISDTHMALAFTCVGIPPHTRVFPMKNELAETVGRQLTAPRVIVPDLPTFPDGSPL
jgi:hypothetical protein